MEGNAAVSFGTAERIEFHLENWRRWMRSGREVDAHARESQVISSGGTSKSFDEMVEAEDRRCARIVDTILDNLPPAERMAIYQYKGITGHVFRFESYPQALSDAKAALGRGLNRCGVW